MKEEVLRLFNVTSDGKVIRIKDNMLMKCCVDSCGYVKFSPRLYGVKYQFKVHRLVAEKHILNPNNLPQVNHINGIKTDNRVENLEWCNSKSNIHHAWKNELSNNNHLKKKVKQINPITNEIVNIFDSFREASLNTGVSETNISAVCRGYKPKNRPEPRQTAGGFKWETCND